MRGSLTPKAQGVVARKARRERRIFSILMGSGVEKLSPECAGVVGKGGKKKGDVEAINEKVVKRVGLSRTTPTRRLKEKKSQSGLAQLRKTPQANQETLRTTGSRKPSSPPPPPKTPKFPLNI